MEIMKVCRVGNALHVTIPASIARELGLTARDHVYVAITGRGSVEFFKVPRELALVSSRGEAP